MKKFSENSLIKEATTYGSGETWKDFFVRQVASGRYWKNLLKDEFETRKFLDKSDALYICKKAQADTYEHIIEKLTGRIDENIIEELKSELQQCWDKDDSALGH